MSNIVPLRSGPAPSVFAGQTLPDMNAAAQAGLAPSFATIGYKGRNWRIKHRSDEVLVKDEKGRPASELPPVVIVGVSPYVSKLYYEKKYAEGDDSPPDCWSGDGVAPDPLAAKPQCSSCAMCPQNAWGSRINDNGKKAKACQDSRRIAVVPAGDVENETYGGPMLLRIPPMSLQNLARYTAELTRFGAQPYMVSTTLAFDYDVAYPLITFKADGWLDEDTARQVVDALQDPLIERMLATGAEGQAQAEAQAAPSALAQGAPPAAFQGISEAEGARIAEADAKASASREAEQEKTQAALNAAWQEKARQEALVQAKAQANASAKAAAMQAEMERREAEAATQVAQAAPAAKKSPFGSPVAAKPEPAAAAAPTAPTAPKPSTVPTVVAGAPEDMGAAIDALLGD